eukprot:g2108.t1
MAGYEKHMHAKFVMEETFAKIYHAKQNAAFQAWVENAGVKGTNVHPDDVELSPAMILKNIKNDMVELFRNIYIGKQTKAEKKTMNTFLKFLKHKKCVGGLHHTFKRLKDDVLTEIISGSTFLQLASGQLVRNYVQCQHPANFFYIVVKGQIKLYQQDEHCIALETLETLKKQPQYIHQANVGVVKFVLNESESFGEQNLILNHPQYYTAIASTSSLLFAIPRTLFYKHLIQFYKELQETYEKTEFLSKVPMFKNLGNARILRISKLLTPFSRASKYTLIKSGTMCNKIIFIQSGEARNGTQLAAVVDGGNIWVSSDSGVTWTETAVSGGSKSWYFVTSSANGARLAATVWGGTIWTSSDSGATWSEISISGGTKNWYGITSSSDGTKLAADVYGGNIWTSSDSGATWVERTVGDGTNNWEHITSSSNGTKLAVGVHGGNIWTSNDSGATWVENTIGDGTNNWVGITSSANGVKLAAVVSGGNIWISGDSGADWTEISVNGGVKNWYAITSSSDGIKLAASVYGGNIWASSNSGATWTEMIVSGGAKNWRIMTLSADGAKLAVTVANGNIYTYEEENE